MPAAERMTQHPDSRLPQRVALGVLLRSFPPARVDQVLEAAGRREQRQRLLPARLMVYFTLGMWIFKALPYELILAQILRDAPGLAPPLSAEEPASAAAIGRARRRLGVEPLRLLFEQAAGSATAEPPVFHGLRPLRLCELDVGMPATPANLSGFAGAAASAQAAAADRQPRAAAPQSPHIPVVPAAQPTGLGTGPVPAVAPYPTPAPPPATVAAPYPVPAAARRSLARMRLFVACGSHRIVAAEVVGAAETDRSPADAVLSGDLLVMDERPLSEPLWTAVENLGGQVLWPLPDQAPVSSGTRMPDGSVLGKLSADEGPELVARVFPSTAGRGAGRLATSILDHRAAPAGELSALYEAPGVAGSGSVFDGIGAYASGDRLELRSKDPDMVRQELYAMLCVHHAIGDLVGPAPLVVPGERWGAPAEGRG